MSSRALRKLQNDEELLESLLTSSLNNSHANSSTDVKKTPKPQVNLFALMNDDSDTVESDASNSEDNNSVKEVQAEKVILPTKTQKKKKQKQKKNKKTNKKINNLSEDVDNNNEEFDKILQKFQKENVIKQGKLAMASGSNDDFDEEFFTASETEDNDNLESIQISAIIKNDIRLDTAFSKFPISSLNHSTGFFNNDFKLLDPHSEFKLLFDDISAESLEDIDKMASTSISPQQLKQIQRMKRLVRNWSGKDHRNVPNGPGTSIHRLQFTKIRNDWIPSQRGELSMKSLNIEELTNWQLWQRPTDWKDVITEDVKKWKKTITFFKFEPLVEDTNRKAMTEFYLSVVLHPDHEALINLIASKFPYFVPGLLQVALITIRQGDKSNTNGLLQRALFVFDRALRNNVKFDGISCQLPYVHFYNRQFYLTIFRYILALAQRGAVGTAGEWCKVLWSLSPLEDPLGCRYFMDHYLLMNNDYQYLIKLSKSPLINTYKQWYTLGLSLGIVLSYLRIEEVGLARKELLKCFNHHPLELVQIFTEKLLGDSSLVDRRLKLEDSHRTEKLELKAYLARFPIIWKNSADISFLHSEIKNILEDCQLGKIEFPSMDVDTSEEEVNPFFIEGIPINLLRFAILSEESSIMAAIPSSIWSDYDVFEFDVLPPQPTTKESIDSLESVKSFINENELVMSQAAMMQDEDMLNQIRQLSLQQYIQQNETENGGIE
ncbi:hypothetical protein NCAS_0F03030 [Naumovozyma castellii]|uniref:Ribosome quality control complex subunit 1 n=1 Tax=Naumovozyma castellii TaxID=27288 RepID=G0VH15_NAUCA|nr:hypothetical protein NCAS_0F03030 [Naumovozyma castellii CBS 4309]CCC70787.1 hypothetical protein NCAS_0F03030 [Naumovozyma castellii CBS 4309]